MRDTAYFLSDIHLGTFPRGSVENRKELLIKFLQRIQNNASHLFLCGDIFEFWMEYKFFIPKTDFDFLYEIKKCVELGIEVHYIAGNHDFNLGSFFASLGVLVHPDFTVQQIQGARLYICHGDGMAKSDGKYRIVKAIIRHPLSNRLFKMLHPDWGMGLANWVGQKSREKGQYKVEPLHEYLEAAAQKLRQYSASIYIQGHTHKPQIQELPEGIYGNIGQWLFQATWLELRDGKLTQGSL